MTAGMSWMAGEVRVAGSQRERVEARAGAGRPDDLDPGGRLAQTRQLSRPSRSRVLRCHPGAIGHRHCTPVPSMQRARLLFDRFEHLLALVHTDLMPLCQERTPPSYGAYILRSETPL